MRIRRLQVRDLRRYRELDIDLAPGVTVVRGPNEAGKSTIQRAIELALTRRVTSSAGDLEALRPWDASADTRPWVAIEFEQEEEDGDQAWASRQAFVGTTDAEPSPDRPEPHEAQGKRQICEPQLIHSRQCGAPPPPPARGRRGRL